ncbi:glycosyltransferase family 2 protein [Pontimonas sp.]|nr:glycosyltransferase family 2 protein [Pontimonas sp.]
MPRKLEGTQVISIILTYYKQPKALDWQLERLESLSALDFELVLVDDGSEDGVPLERLRRSTLSGKLITLKRDVKWNIPGARNWGFALASFDKCLTTDLDHRPTRETLENLVTWGRLRGKALLFSRRDESGSVMRPHTDSFFLSRDDFWEIGGYDERFSGAYGQNARDFGFRASLNLELIQTKLELETDLRFRSDGGSRSIWSNRLKVAVLDQFPTRRIKRLQENITVARF